MSEENKIDDNAEDSLSKGGESSALSVSESKVEAKLEAIIEAVPAPQREEARHTFQEFMGYVERSSTQKVDPEVAKILAAICRTHQDTDFDESEPPAIGVGHSSSAGTPATAGGSDISPLLGVRGI